MIKKTEINWHSHPLTLDTVITDSYKTTQNVRRFFKGQLDRDIKFTRDMYAWLHNNVGKTLAEAVDEYKLRNGIV
jgi:hypothetical protein